MGGLNPITAQDTKYFNDLQNLSTSGLSEKEKDTRIAEIFTLHADNLIADLIANPNHREIYQRMSTNLKKESLQTSINYVQKISSLIQNIDSQELKNISRQIKKGEMPALAHSIILSNFSKMKLPGCLKDLEIITHPEIRAHLIAALINRDSVSLEGLPLRKNELLQIAPHLTYLVPGKTFDRLTKNEIDEILQSCKNVKTLVLHNTQITELPDFPECELLDCSGCGNLTKISTMPLCKLLNCNNCTNLRELPPLPFCQELLCISCSNLTKLKDLSRCEKINCSYCQNLIEITSLSECKALNCHACKNLIWISMLPKCEILKCTDCINIPRIPRMLDCETLDCSGCTSLLSFPSLQSCRTLNYDRCPNLDLSTLPIQFRGNIPSFQNVPIARRGKLNVVNKELNENPKKVLLDLDVSLLHRGVLPGITFIEDNGRAAAGIDAGGVTRVFISRLMKSLITHANEPSQLDFQAADSGFFIPIFNSEKNVNEQIKSFQLIGSIFSICYEQANTSRLTTGILFDRSLFEIITKLEFEDLSSLDANAKEIPDNLRLKLISLSANKHLSDAAKLLMIPPHALNDKEFETLKEIALANSDEENIPPNINKISLTNEQLLSVKSWVSNQVKGEFLEDSKKLDPWLAAVLIAKRMQIKRQTKEEWNILRQAGASQLELNVQGVINKQALISAIAWNTERRLDNERVEKTKEFVTQWINEASLQDLENLSNFIAGSPTINPQKKLSFVLYDTPPNRLPSTHTCSFQIDLSVNYGTFEKFKAKLEMALTAVNSLESSGLETA